MIIIFLLRIILDNELLKATYIYVYEDRIQYGVEL